MRSTALGTGSQCELETARTAFRKMTNKALITSVSRLQRLSTEIGQTATHLALNVKFCKTKQCKVLAKYGISVTRFSKMMEGRCTSLKERRPYSSRRSAGGEDTPRTSRVDRLVISPGGCESGVGQIKVILY